MLEKTLLSSPDGVRETLLSLGKSRLNRAASCSVEYRPSPQEFAGPVGVGRTEIDERQTVYYELMPESETFHLYADGWRFLRKMTGEYATL